jgi:hypothetical protein
VGRKLLAVSRRINVDALAVTSGGTVVVNIAHFDVARRPELLLALAVRLRGPLFVGVELSEAEVRDAAERLRAGHAEAVAYIVGKRRKRSQRAAR